MKLENGKPVIESSTRKRRTRWITGRSAARSRWHAPIPRPPSRFTTPLRPYEQRHHQRTPDWLGWQSLSRRQHWAAANNTNPSSPCYEPCGSWRYNSWYGLVTTSLAAQSALPMGIAIGRPGTSCAPTIARRLRAKPDLALAASAHRAWVAPRWILRSNVERRLLVGEFLAGGGGQHEHYSVVFVEQRVGRARLGRRARQVVAS